MDRPRVFLPKPLKEETMARLDSKFEIRVWEGDGKCPPEVAASEVAQADAALGYYRWTADLFEGATRLRIIASTSVGYDHIDVAAATAKRIVVTNTPDVLTETTADLAFSLLMSIARRLGEAERFIRRGQWTALRGSETLLGRDIYGATLGIIGLGRIGSAMARRGSAFNMKVLYTDLARRLELEEKYGYQFVEMDELLQNADFVSLHVPLLHTTRKLMGKREFSLMKRSACLVNASRGPVVDEAALIAALSEGRIAGAGLDVFEVEPVSPDNPLLKMDNVVAVPHIGSATVATRFAMETLATDNVLAVLQGKPPLTPVNPEVLK